MTSISAPDHRSQWDRDAAHISARIDAMPSARPVWLIVFLLSLGLFCEIYDASITPYLGPGLIKAGVFKPGGAGLFGLSDIATFIAATFAGLWIGTLGFSALSDRWGRLPALKFSMIWYSATTLIMGLQSSAINVDIFRLLTGIGMGVQMLATDCFIAEITPKALRGRAFAASTAIQFCASPVAAGLALVLIPSTPLGLAGWRWLSFAPAFIALIVLVLQRNLHESPRWLAQAGRTAEASAIVDRLEAKVRAVGLKPSTATAAQEEAVISDLKGSLSKTETARRLVMMSAANFLQAIGYYGFANWVPSLLQAKGADLSHSLLYSASIAISFPLAPLIFFFFADRFERKQQLMAGCLSAAVVGLIFAQQSSPLMWVVMGVLVTISNNLMAFSLHTYQAEIFPTRSRARSVGLVYSFTRLSTIFSGYIVAYLLQKTSVTGVFIFLDGALVLAAIIVGVLGPRTRGLALEQIVRSKA